MQKLLNVLFPIILKIQTEWDLDTYLETLLNYPIKYLYKAEYKNMFLKVLLKIYVKRTSSILLSCGNYER